MPRHMKANRASGSPNMVPRITAQEASRSASSGAARGAQHPGAQVASQAALQSASQAAPQPTPAQRRARHVRGTITRWRMRGVVAFAALMVIGGLVGLLFFARPTTSAVEMRNLTAFPEFTVERFLNGEFFTDVSLWYADTYPLREPMVAADHAIDGLFGVNTGTGMVGGNVKADEIPVAQDPGDQQGASDAPAPAPPKVLAAAPDEKAVAADIQDNVMSGIYIHDGAGYSIYYFSQAAADTYVAAMNKAVERLDGKAAVYSIMAPANSITLPDDQAAQLGGSDQEQTLAYLDSRFDDRVKSVGIVDDIKAHRDEYLYFRTDHHWTQLGAYYAYVAFCEQAGLEPKALADWTEVDLGEFQGTYHDTIEEMGGVANDEAIAYIPSGTNDMTYWTDYDEEIAGHVINTEAASWDPSYKYSAFIAGDQPLSIIRNPKADGDRSCLVVKDSYGCAFVPNLVDSYSEVHVIDFRKTDENIVDYAIEHGIDDVIFMTGMKIGLTDSVAALLLEEVSEPDPEPEAIIARVIWASRHQVI